MRLDLVPDGDLAALVRRAEAESLVVVIEQGREPLALALALAKAAIGPLAIELAPAIRLNAVIAAPDADAADVEAAVAWLERARSTTGQLLEISARAASCRTAPANR